MGRTPSTARGAEDLGEIGPDVIALRDTLGLPGMNVLQFAFGDDECGLAELSRHHCPTTLGAELARLRDPVQVHITHIKPGEREAVMSAVTALSGPHRISALEHDQEFDLR